MTIEQILNSPNCEWKKENGASEEQIISLISESSINLPDEYLDLLRYSNGGIGDINLPPCWLQLNNIEEVISNIHDNYYHDNFPGLFVFANNGGIELIAFDMRLNISPLPIIMIDPVAGFESVVQIASDMKDFILAIGKSFELINDYRDDI